MRKILGFSGGAIMISLLISGCSNNVSLDTPPASLFAYKRLMVSNIDNNQSSVSVFALSKGYLVHGFSLNRKDIQKGIIQSSSDEETKCIFGAEAKADLNSERFFIRLNTATCTTENNNTFVSNNIKGYVVGPDNQVGIKGVVIARQGGLLMQHLQNKISKVENIVSDNNATTKVTFNDAILDSLSLESGSSMSLPVVVVATEGDFIKTSR